MEKLRWIWINKKNTVILLLGLLITATIIAMVLWNTSNFPWSSSQENESLPHTSKAQLELDPPATETDPFLSAEDLLKLVENGSIQFIALSEDDHQHRTFKYQDEMFFSTVNPRIRLLLDIPEGKQVSDIEYERFTRQIEVKQAGKDKAISFTIEKGEVTSVLPIIIQLQGAPRKDVVVLLHSLESNEPIAYHFTYRAPFRYNVTSLEDDSVESYFTMSQSGHEFAKYMPLGEHTFQITFSLDVDHDSAESLLREGLGDVEWSVEWEESRSLQLKMNLQPKDVDKRLRIDMNGVIGQAGFELKYRSYLLFIPTAMKTYRSVDIQTGQVDELFSTSIQYSTLDVAPQGLWALAKEEAYSNYYEERYSLLDINGELIASFDPAEVSLPQWLPDGNSFLYVQGRELIQYKVKSKSKHVVWTSPQKIYTSRIVSLSIDRESGRIAVGSTVPTAKELGEYTTYDLYLFNDIMDKEPRVLESLAYFVCMDGPCYGTTEFVNSQKLIYLTRLPDVEQAMHIYLAPYEYHILDFESTDSILIETIAADEIQFVSVFPSKGSIFVLNQQQLSDAVHWSVIDAQSGLRTDLFNTDSTYFQYGNIFVPYNGQRHLVGIPSKGWYTIDTKEKKMTPYPQIPMEVLYVDWQDDHLIYPVTRHHTFGFNKDNTRGTAMIAEIHLIDD